MPFTDIQIITDNKDDPCVKLYGTGPLNIGLKGCDGIGDSKQQMIGDAASQYFNEQDNSIIINLGDRLYRLLRGNHCATPEDFVTSIENPSKESRSPHFLVTGNHDCDLTKQSYWYSYATRNYNAMDMRYLIDYKSPNTLTIGTTTFSKNLFPYYYYSIDYYNTLNKNHLLTKIIVMDTNSLPVHLAQQQWLQRVFSTTADCIVLLGHHGLEALTLRLFKKETIYLANFPHIDKTEQPLVSIDANRSHNERVALTLEALLPAEVLCSGRVIYGCAHEHLKALKLLPKYNHNIFQIVSGDGGGVPQTGRLDLLGEANFMLDSGNYGFNHLQITELGWRLFAYNINITASQYCLRPVADVQYSWDPSLKKYLKNHFIINHDNMINFSINQVYHNLFKNISFNQLIDICRDLLKDNTLFASAGIVSGLNDETIIQNFSENTLKQKLGDLGYLYSQALAPVETILRENIAKLSLDDCLYPVTRICLHFICYYQYLDPLVLGATFFVCELKEALEKYIADPKTLLGATMQLASYKLWGESEKITNSREYLKALQQFLTTLYNNATESNDPKIMPTLTPLLLENTHCAQLSVLLQAIFKNTPLLFVKSTGLSSEIPLVPTPPSPRSFAP